MTCPAVTNARWVIEQEEIERRLRDPLRHEWRRLWRAIMLSPSIDVCEALLRGESVPIDRLDAHWVERFGLRSR
jgi:hypothetical protein